MGYPLAPHQRRALEFMESHDVGWLIYEAGTGKTVIALSWILRGIVSGIIENALILCPASLVPRWWSEVDKIPLFEDYTDFDVDLLKDVLTVSSISSVWRTERKEVRHRDGSVSVKKYVRLRDTLRRPWSAVIIDESHRLGSPSTNVTKACIELSGYAQRRFLLTGTPDCGIYTKLYGQVRFLDPGRWRSFSEFKSRYVLRYDYFRNPKEYDVPACEALKHEYGIVARLSECFDMPEFIETDIPCPLAAPRLYADLKRGDVEKYGLTVRATGVLPIKSYQVASGHLRVDSGVIRCDTSKVPALRDLMDGYEGKVVIMCKYKESIRIVAETLESLGMAFHIYDGDTADPVWESFQRDESRAIIVQYQRAVGIDLYAACMMILFEPTFSEQELEQTRRRIYRKGQTNTCRYYYLTTPDTFESRTWESVRSGVDVSTAMLEAWAREDRFIS